MRRDHTCGLPGSTPRRQLNGRLNSRRTTPDRTTRASPSDVRVARRKLPDVFYGQFLFMAEATDAEGLKLRPTFVTSPSGNVPVFGRFYRKMAERLARAVEELAVAEPLVPKQYQRTFAAESSPLRWFYHTARDAGEFLRVMPVA